MLIVLDGVGIGALPDAFEYGDEGSNSVLHCAQAVGGVSLPSMERLGLAHLIPYEGSSCATTPVAHFGRMAAASPGKDTTTGHWEIAGLILDRPFRTFPDGIPSSILKTFEKELGTATLGGYAASGTAIIESLGTEHLRTGRPIIYTSADSVFQIAAHLDICSLPQLYRMCELARRLLDPHYVARVIARPFRGSPGSFYRTPERKDFSIIPIAETVLDMLTKRGILVAGIGKIHDIFAGRGISHSFHTESSLHGIHTLLNVMQTMEQGLIFLNLIDFDMLYGHRRDPEGYAGALEAFDRAVPEILHSLRDHDLLMLTSDHGCDPTYPGTDHTREFVPLLVYHNSMTEGRSLGTRSTFADIAATIADIFTIPYGLAGKSFSDEIV